MQPTAVNLAASKKHTTIMVTDTSTQRVIKLLSSTSGRDKLYRSLQYGGKALWWGLEQRGGHADIVKKIKVLESHLSTGRKLYRILNSVKLLNEALAFLQNDDPVIRLVVTLSKMNSAFYMLFDHILWADRIGLTKVDAKYYSQLSNRFWLATLILNLTRDLYEFFLLLNDLPQMSKQYGEQSPRANNLGESSDSGSSDDIQTLNGNIPRRKVSWHSDVIERVPTRVTARGLVSTIWSDRKEVVLDTVKNACDLALPASSLGYIDLTPGQKGVYGLISSLIGLLTVWDSRYKL